MSVYTDKNNNSSKIIFFNLAFGFAVSLLHFLSEYMQIQIKDFEWITQALAFLLSALIVIVIKKTLPILTIHDFFISFLFIIGICLKNIAFNHHTTPTTTEEDTTLSNDNMASSIYINLSCSIIVSLFSPCLDRKNQFKCLHYIGIIMMMVSFGIYAFFNIKIDYLIHLVDSRQIINIAASIVCLSATFIYQQIYFVSGGHIYHFLQLQGAIGFLVLSSMSVFYQEIGQLLEIKGLNYDVIPTYLFYALSFTIFVIFYPFYLKMAHCVMASTFIGWKGIMMINNEWFSAIIEVMLFVIGGISFNFKRLMKKGEEEEMKKKAKNNQQVHHDNYSEKSDMISFQPLLNDAFKDNDTSIDSAFSGFKDDNSVDRQLNLFRQRK